MCQHFSAELQWDICKACDHVRWELVVDKAIEMGYPLRVLEASLLGYSWPRQLLVGMTCGFKMFPKRWLAAGSAGAPYELAVLLLPIIREHQRLRPSVRLSIHVDDITQEVDGTDQEKVIHDIVESARFLASRIEGQASLPIDKGDKAFVLASHNEIAGQIQDRLGSLAGKCVTEVKRLGVDHTHRMRKKGVRQTTKKRFESGKQRVRRLLRIRQKAVSPKIFAAGIKPHVLYGIELYEPDDQQIRQLRGWAAACGTTPERRAPSMEYEHPQRPRF